MMTNDTEDAWSFSNADLREDIVSWASSSSSSTSCRNVNRESPCIRVVVLSAHAPDSSSILQMLKELAPTLGLRLFSVRFTYAQYGVAAKEWPGTTTSTTNHRRAAYMGAGLNYSFSHDDSEDSATETYEDGLEEGDEPCHTFDEDEASDEKFFLEEWKDELQNVQLHADFKMQIPESAILTTLPTTTTTRANFAQLIRDAEDRPPDYEIYEVGGLSAMEGCGGVGGAGELTHLWYLEGLVLIPDSRLAETLKTAIYPENTPETVVLHFTQPPLWLNADKQKRVAFAEELVEWLVRRTSLIERWKRISATIPARRAYCIGGGMWFDSLLERAVSREADEERVVEMIHAFCGHTKKLAERLIEGIVEGNDGSSRKRRARDPAVGVAKKCR